jgi:cell division protease FtsH
LPKGALGASRSDFVGNARNIAFWVVLFLLILALFQMFSGSTSTQSSRAVAYSEFIARVESGDVASVTLDGEKVNAARMGRFTAPSHRKTPR